MRYILLLSSSMLGERINRGEQYKNYKIVEGVGIILHLISGEHTLIPFHQIRRIHDLDDKKGG